MIHLASRDGWSHIHCMPLTYAVTLAAATMAFRGNVSVHAYLVEVYNGLPPVGFSFNEFRAGVLGFGGAQ